MNFTAAIKKLLKQSHGNFLAEMQIASLFILKTFPSVPLYMNAYNAQKCITKDRKNDREMKI